MTKRIIFIFLTGLLSSTLALAQDETDALRYSRITTGGDARTQAIGGAMGSLGGNISALSVNPAGIGLFKTNELSVTPGFRSISNDASYYNTSASDSKSSLFLQNAGLILATGKRRNSKSRWQNVTFGMSLNRLANFNNSLFYQGMIPDKASFSSYSDNYLIQLNDNNETSYDNASSNYPFGTSEAVHAGLVAPVQDDNQQFQGWSSLPNEIIKDGYALSQSNTISTKGGLNEFSLGVAGNYADKFYLGASLNVPSIRYDRTKTFRETNTEDKQSVLNYYDVEENLHTDGVGINGKIGAIFSPVPAFRIGAAFHTPTVYSMHDTYSTLVTTNTTDLGVLSAGTEDITGGYPGDYSYSLTTPWRAVASASYIFGISQDVSQQHGFITLDYEYVNYAAARFHFNGADATADDKAQADALNQAIKNTYRGASNVRFGGELKLGMLAVRAGLAWYGSPYEDTDIKGDRMLYSGGLGIRNHGFFADLTYVYENEKGVDQPYYISSNGGNIPSPEAATFTSGGSNIILTIGFKL